MSEITVRPVAGDADLKAFIRLPHQVYFNDFNWVPPLDSDLAETLDAARNPFFGHAERELFIAIQDGRVLGRIVAIIDRNYVAYHKENIGYFGFFETVKNYDVAKALFDKVRDWLRERKMTRLRGPANPSLNDESGMLMEGFDSPPMIKMSYNPPYYLEFCARYGMTKSKDLFAYSLPLDIKPPDKLMRVMEHLKQRPGLVVRPLNLKDMKHELRLFKEIYNDAWSRNWDFAPMTDPEIDDVAKKLKPLLVPDIVPFVFIDGEVAGVSVALPNYNELLRTMRGKLDVAKFLFGRGRIKSARLWALGVKYKYHKLGLDALLYYETFQGARRKGYTWGEVSWILEDNIHIIRPILMWKADLYKKYRVFEIAV